MRFLPSILVLGVQAATLPAFAQTAASAPAASPPAPAPISPLPIRYTASFFTRYELREGYRDLGRSAGRFQEGEATAYRARLGLTTAPMNLGGQVETVLQFTPQVSGWLGQTDTIVDYNLGLYEGYLRVQDTAQRVVFDVGRFRMDYGDALVIGDLGWHQTGRAFEGLRARWALDAGWIDTFFTQLSEGRPLSDGFGAGDRYFYGVYAALGPLVTKTLALDLYALGQTSPKTVSVLDNPSSPMTRTATINGATELTLGARAKHKVDVFDYRLEADLQFGSRPATARPTVPATEPAPELESVKALAYQIDGEVGLSALGGAFRAAAGALVASGDDVSTSKSEGYNQLYPTAHKFLGLSDIFGGRSNVFSINGSLAYKLGGSLTFMAQPHVLWTMQTQAPGVEDYTGTELDLHTIYQLGQGLTLRGMYGIFFANDHGPYQDAGPAHYLELELAFVLK
ncbi:MAG: alginate export family protein [Deltaproteobacteria bacterium]